VINEQVVTWAAVTEEDNRFRPRCGEKLPDGPGG
jgi:hypothetical protein